MDVLIPVEAEDHRLAAALGDLRGPDGRPAPGPLETLDRICGDWHIFQLRGGHRFSVDDQLTAWLSARLAPAAHRLLDLGAGIGSVGLMALWRRPADATVVLVEAQAASHRLCRRTLAWNGLEARATALQADLRGDVPLGPFDAITGSPPYIPAWAGVVSPHPQRAACRMELRGDVFDYCAAAAPRLAPGGHLALCHAAGDRRPPEAIAAAGLRLWARIDVFFRRGRAPTISLYAAGPGEPPAAVAELPGAIVIRDADGAFTAEALAIRREMGGVTDVDLP